MIYRWMRKLYDEQQNEQNTLIKLEEEKMVVEGTADPVQKLRESEVGLGLVLILKSRFN